MRLFLTFLIAFSVSVSQPAYAQDGLKMDELQSAYHLFLGKLLYQRFGNYEGAEFHFKKVNGKQKKEAYAELGSLYLERSHKETKPENRLIYQRKAIDAFGRFLASADSRDKKDAPRYYQAKYLRSLLESQVNARIAPQFVGHTNTYSTRYEPEFTSRTHSLRKNTFNEPVGGLREPLRMNSGESKGFSLTERGDTFHREEPFRIDIKTRKGSSSTSKGGGGGYGGYEQVQVPQFDDAAAKLNAKLDANLETMNRGQPWQLQKKEMTSQEFKSLSPSDYVSAVSGGEKATAWTLVKREGNGSS